MGEGQRRGQKADHVGTGGHGKDFGLFLISGVGSRGHARVITVNSELWHCGKLRDE